ncbi:T9SS type A sorting domain-containing protein [Lewinella sp. IMCC34183]|uniref:T9SS type A sorting domain-containing protein n=1 Tax=Lewinella sp. IMCC34183 TaxID=2248762 RepID=UPI000E268356|nr:T9SS type A sorting domain-containing protein [Lewinella sp. IMCC34183]
MASFNFVQSFFLLASLLLSFTAGAADCKCTVSTNRGETVYSPACATPEEVCSIEVKSGVEEVDLRAFTDLRGVEIKLHKSLEVILLGSAAADARTRIKALGDVRVNIYDDILDREVALHTADMYGYNAELAACPDNCTLLTSSVLGGLTGFRAASALPVSLLTYTAAAGTAGVTLDWATGQETDNDYFAVLHSTDGTHFTPLAQVAGRGTTAEGGAYRYVDANAGSGAHYYRLEQVDFDGTRTVLGIRQVSIAAPVTRTAVSLSPNPATLGGEVRIEVAEPLNTPVRIVDLAGRPVAETGLDAGGRFRVPTGLQPGLYVVVVRDQATRMVVRP